MPLSPARQRLLIYAAVMAVGSAVISLFLSSCAPYQIPPEVVAESARAYKVRQNARYERQAYPAGCTCAKCE